jgi:hypothetical protein
MFTATVPYQKNAKLFHIGHVVQSKDQKKKRIEKSSKDLVGSNFVAGFSAGIELLSGEPISGSSA